MTKETDKQTVFFSEVYRLVGFGFLTDGNEKTRRGLFRKNSTIGESTQKLANITQKLTADQTSERVSLKLTYVVHTIDQQNTKIFSCRTLRPR